MLTTLESHITGVRDAELNKMLAYAAESLDLTPTQFADAESKFKAVGAFLSEPETLLAWLSPVIWPHGSRDRNLVVKPLGRSVNSIWTLRVRDVASRQRLSIVRKAVGWPPPPTEQGLNSERYARRNEPLLAA